MYSGNVKFSEFIFNPNPYLIKVESSYGEGASSTAVSGEGEFKGTNAFSKYKLLKELFMKGESAWLRLPKVKPLFAKLIGLNLIEDARENMVSYSFRFQEVEEKYTKPSEISYIVADDEKSLWDIERKYGVDVKTLLELNPEFPDCYSFATGDRIRIA